jgi:hypothetical protein
LNRAAVGKLVFAIKNDMDIGRKKGEMVMEETQGEARQALRYDYVMTGTINSELKVFPEICAYRLDQITFGLVQPGSGTVLCGGKYYFRQEEAGYLFRSQ